MNRIHSLFNIIIFSLIVVSCKPSQSAEKASEIYFIAQRDYNSAFLFNSDRKILHKWQDLNNEDETKRGWHNAKMTSDGGLVVINKGRSLFKFDKASKQIFEINGGYHHDLTLDSQDNIYAIKRKIEEVIAPAVFDERPVVVLNEYVAVHSSDGTLIKEVPVYEAVKHLIPKRIFQAIFNNPDAIAKPDTELDIFHANSIDLYQKDLSNNETKLNCADNSYLLSLRTINLVVIIDAETGKICWDSSSLNLEQQHHASFINENYLSIFNNRTKKVGSELLLINPATKTVFKSVSAKGEDKFYTKSGGSVQLLKNGNFLVGLTSSGKILEVDGSGRVLSARLNDFRSPGEGDKFFRIRKIENLANYPVIRSLIK